MVGSIIGVGLANQVLSLHSGTSGLDWQQVIKVLKALLISPLLGFALAGLLILISKRLIKFPSLYEAPKNNQPPPWPIRGLLIGTCTGVSFFHGSNDGQKGMGLIMLILVGTVPTAYAINHNASPGEIQGFAAASTQVAGAISHYVDPAATAAAAQPELEHFVATRKYEPSVMLALQQQVTTIRNEATFYGSIGGVPANMQASVRSQMYLTSETLRLLPKAVGAPKIAPADARIMSAYKGFLDRSTRFIPLWVKVAVALALGLGTMVGWKRIVITVGEKIGKTHLTYAQGASAQLVAMCTILVADTYGLPVSTTHVLNSGIAGTMTANGSGLQWSTIRNIAMAWVFTLPIAALLSGSLFWLFNKIAG
jgi:PiT family inorganic phosphate transporter